MNKVSLELQLKASTTQFSAGMRNARGDIEKMTVVANNFRKAFSNLGKAGTDGTRALVKELEALIRTLDQASQKGKTAMSQLTPKQNVRLQGQLLGVAGAFKSAMPSAVEAASAKEIAKQEAEISKYNRTLITMRYSLYDVAGAMQQAGQALSAFSNASITAAAAQEAAFSQVQKTQVGIKGANQQLEILRSQLLSLSTEIPVSFAQLSQIATLGAQLGIPTNALADFTDVVAKFSAISGVAVEETAMSFGKLANILDLNATQYQALGSAIAEVGVKAAATEQQIMNTAGQIGAIGKAAGLSNSEIIGLASAMASLKIAPEEARGVLMQAFHEIDRAVASYSEGLGKGNERLNKFAEISGMTAEDFYKSWSDKTDGGAGKVWKNFVSGLGKSGDVSRGLRQLGLEGVRVSKGLTALANGASELNRQLEISRASGADGTFLDKSYSVIADTLASKLTMLKDAAENAMAALSNNPVVMGFLKMIVDLTTRILDGFRKLSEIPGLGFLVTTLTGLAVAIAGIGGTLITVIAALGIAAGSFLALRTAIATFRTELGGAQLTLGSIIKLLFTVPEAGVAAKTGLDAASAGANGLSVATKGAQASIFSLKTALISTGIGALVVVLGSLAAEFLLAAPASDNLAAGLDETQKRSKDAADELSSLTTELSQFIDLALQSDNAMIDLQDSLYSLGQAAQQNGKDFSVMSDSGRKNLKALGATISSITKSAAGNQQELANSLTALKLAMQQAGIVSADAFTMIDNAISATGLKATNTSADLSSFFSGLESSSQSAGKTVKTTLDYASDLIGVIKNAATIQFGRQNGIVAMNDTIAKMKENAQDTTKRIKELQATLREKRGNQQQLQARVQLATQFGATDIAAKAQAQLDAVNEEISTAQSELKYNIDRMSGSLNLNTQAGRDNYKAIQELANGYMEYINGVAQSAKSQKDVIDATKESRKGFEAQLKTMGISKDKIEELTSQFDGFALIARRIAPSLTLSVKTSAAQQAIDAFITQNSNRTVTVNTSANTSGTGASGLPAGKYADKKLTSQDENILRKYLEIQSSVSLIGSLSNPSKSQKNLYNYNVQFLKKYLDKFPWLIDQSGIVDPTKLKKYASGGLISGAGSGTSDSIPAYVSNGEFVMSAAAVSKYGVGMMNAMNSGKFSGSGAGSIISLSPEDRALLRAAISKPVTLYANDKEIASSANRGNKVIAKTGRG